MGTSIAKKTFNTLKPELKNADLWDSTGTRRDLQCY